MKKEPMKMINRHIKTFEGFFDFLKTKPKKGDQFITNLISEISNLSMAEIKNKYKIELVDSIPFNYPTFGAVINDEYHETSRSIFINFVKILKSKGFKTSTLNLF